jgi:hypothetical protein
MVTKFRFICATRESPQDFPVKTALGRTLATYNYLHTEVRLFPSNSAGLPTVYNCAIREAAADPAVLIFLHDDIHICDFFWPGTMLGGLARFDIIGLAGNRRRLPLQPGWYFADKKLTPDDAENLSGVVAHGISFPPKRLDIYGQSNQEVKLLDGLLLAAHSRTLLDHNLFFDERFEYHHYDMDFCREAETRNLRMGTVQLSVIHESRGGFASEKWWKSYQTYMDKWRQ